MGVYDNVTVEQFKDYYARDFSALYLPVWSVVKTYSVGDKVYYSDTQKFYQSLVDNNSSLPTSDEWELIEDDVFNFIQDSDIAKAMGQAKLSINSRFGADDDERVLIFLHLVAFYLLLDLKNAGASVGSSFNGVVSSKSVGDVSESYAIPEYITKNPLYSMYAQNGYGLKYLSLIMPYMACTLGFFEGRTTCG